MLTKLEKRNTQQKPWKLVETIAMWCDLFNRSFTSWNLIALSTSSYLRHAVLW